MAKKDDEDILEGQGGDLAGEKHGCKSNDMENMRSKCRMGSVHMVPKNDDIKR